MKRFRLLKPMHGRCLGCGCTQDNGCVGRGGPLEPCGWAGESQLLCTACASRLDVGELLVALLEITRWVPAMSWSRGSAGADAAKVVKAALRNARNDVELGG